MSEERYNMLLEMHRKLKKDYDKLKSEIVADLKNNEEQIIKDPDMIGFLIKKYQKMK